MRDWLRNKYPKGIGLGNLIYEYTYAVEQTNILYGTPSGREQLKRQSEIRLVLNYLYKLNSSPIFPDEFDGSFKI